MCKKKLLVFHQSLAPYRVNLWNSLNDNFDFEIHFIDENVQEQKFDQVRLKSLLNFKPNYLAKGFRLGFRAIRFGFYRIIKQFNPDIVFVYEFSQTAYAICLLKWLFGFSFKIYSVCDDSLDIAVNCKGVRKYFRDHLIPNIDGLIVVNQEVANWYKSNFNLEEFIVFPIIYDETNFRRELELSLPQSNNILIDYKLIGKKVLFFVGRFVEIKGIDKLFEAFKLINSDVPEAVLVLIGDGDLKKQYQNLATELNIQDKVIFAGRHEGINLSAWYNVGQLFVLPSYYEPFGAVINEALLSGEVVLCSKLAGASSLISPGVNGNVFNPLNIEDLASNLKSELQNLSPAKLLQNIRPSKAIGTFKEYVDELVYKFYSN
jgi:glycosyltransferase involved in cell wall biosynthesis